MTFSSALSGRLAPSMLRRLRAVTLGAVLAAIIYVPASAPLVVSAAPTVLGISTNPLAFQHSAEDKVAYPPGASLLIGFFDGSNVDIRHVTNPSTTPVSTNVDTIGGSEVTFYTLPGASSTE